MEPRGASSAVSDLPGCTQGAHTAQAVLLLAGVSLTIQQIHSLVIIMFVNSSLCAKGT